MWLRMACRFSDADVTIDGRAAPKGFAGGLYRMCLEDPVPCTLGLTRRGEEPVLWLLRNGIVAARATVPGYPPFEAAVELGGVISGAAGGSELRRAVRPHMSELCDRAVDMMIDVAGRPRRVFGPEGQRLIALLLRAARRDLRTVDILAMPLIPTLDRETPPLSTARLEAMARRSGGRSFAVAPDEADEDVLADPSSTVVASSEVRNLLNELAGVRFQLPPRRRLGTVQRLGDTSRRAVRRFLERLRGALRPQIAAPGVLSSGERRVLTGLRAALSPRTVDLGDCRHLRRTATGLVVPRLESSVAAAASWSDEDEGWLYPLILALKLDVPSPESARTNWALGVADHPTSPPIASPPDGPDGVERP
jgi:hypothetical protein